MLGNEQLTTLMAVARKVFNSGFVPKDCTSEDAVFAMMLMGVELGFEPMQSLAAVHSIKGKLSLRTDAMVALCVRSPVCKHFVLVEGTDKVATYEALREGHPAPTRLTYRIEQAQRAGLLSNPQWKNHPEAMLRARCSGALARLVFPDLVAGVYIPDEAEEIAANDNAPRAIVRQVASPEFPPPAPPVAPAPQEPAALAAWRARVGACVVSDELVAVRLSLAPSLAALSEAERAEAGKIAREKGIELFGNVDDFKAAVEAAQKLSKEPAHWSVIAAATAAMVGAKTSAALDAATKEHTVALSALPQDLKDKMAVLLRARRAAFKVAASTQSNDIAAAIEEALRAAEGIPALEEVAEKIEAAAKAGTITREQATALVKLYNDLVAALEREPSVEEDAA